MIELGLVLGAGAASLAGLTAITWAALARTDAGNRRGLRAAQAGLTLAGVLMFLSYFAYGAEYGLTGGVLLLLFGTGMTAIGRRRSLGR